MSLVGRILTLVLATTLVAGAVAYGRALASRRALPTAIPAAWAPDATAPSAWIFVRRGCAHCDAHLAALARATERRGAGRQILGRIHVVGDAGRVPAGVRREPDRLRRELGVRTTPTTLLVEPGGRVHRAWSGARGAPAWEQALDFVEGRAVTR